MGALFFLVHCSIVLSIFQRSRVSTQEITLPEAIEDMETDQPAVPGPAGNDDGKANAEKSLRESRDYKTLARRENKDSLRTLCQDRGLDDTLCKTELARQLINWVSAPTLLFFNSNLI
jgi:hypothetical protein